MGSFQTILGPAPDYLPTPLYYGLLFLSGLSYVSPAIGMPLITAGTSGSIKAYGFLIPTELIIVIINKDTNPNASGVVNVTISSNEIIKCQYLSAPSLSSTSGVTWMGYSFINGSSAPQGNYTFFVYNYLNPGTLLLGQIHTSSPSTIPKQSCAISPIQTSVSPLWKNPKRPSPSSYSCCWQCCFGGSDSH